MSARPITHVPPHGAADSTWVPGHHRTPSNAEEVAAAVLRRREEELKALAPSERAVAVLRDGVHEVPGAAAVAAAAPAVIVRAGVHGAHTHAAPEAHLAAAGHGVGFVLRLRTDAARGRDPHSGPETPVVVTEDGLQAIPGARSEGLPAIGSRFHRAPDPRVDRK